MTLRMYRMTCLAIVGVALLATNLNAQKKPKNPPPNPAGVLYFMRAGQVWQMNGDGSGKAAALDPTFTDPLNSAVERPAIGRPSSLLYDGCRWWLYPQDKDGIEQTYDYDLWAFCSDSDGHIVDHVQLTKLPPGLSVNPDFKYIQWSNDGNDTFCSVLLGDPTEIYPRWYLWRLRTEPILFGSLDYPLFGSPDYPLNDSSDRVFDENDHHQEAWPPSKYSWHPSGNQIAYWVHPPETLSTSPNKLALFIRNLNPSENEREYEQVPLNLNQVQDITNLSWSPDGQRIMFFAWAHDATGANLNAWWTVRPDGTELTMLDASGSPSTVNASKKWSLDSAWVTYEAYIGAKIYLIKPDKTAGPYDLTSDLKVSGRTPEQRRMLDWVSKTDVVVEQP